MDAMTWMYEAAYMPQKGDVQDAMTQAARYLEDDYELYEDLWQPVLLLYEGRRGPKEWSPRKRYQAAKIIESLLDHVTLEQEEGHYDQYLVFDFRNAPVVHELLSRSPWTEEKLVHDLQREFKVLQEQYLSKFFYALEKEMEDVDITNRTNWRKAWRSMLESGVAPGVQKEMAEAIRSMPPGWPDE
jgi:hypothetical protein